MKYLHISYSAPAVVGINITVEADEWHAMPEINKAGMIQDALNRADSVLSDNEDNCDAYVPDKTVDLSKLEIEEEEVDDEWKPAEPVDSAMEEGTRYERAFGDGSDIG